MTVAGGYESVELKTLFDWQSRIWSLGPSISVPIFMGGRNTASLKAGKARYEESVVKFRQKVLVSFREVEDALVNLRLRGEQAKIQAEDILISREIAKLSNIRYQRGLISYSEVINAENDHSKPSVLPPRETGKSTRWRLGKKYLS